MEKPYPVEKTVSISENLWQSSKIELVIYSMWLMMSVNWQMTCSNWLNISFFIDFVQVHYPVHIPVDHPVPVHVPKPVPVHVEKPVPVHVYKVRKTKEPKMGSGWTSTSQASFNKFEPPTWFFEYFIPKLNTNFKLFFFFFFLPSQNVPVPVHVSLHVQLHRI